MLVNDQIKQGEIVMEVTSEKIKDTNVKHYCSACKGWIGWICPELGVFDKRWKTNGHTCEKWTTIG